MTVPIASRYGTYIDSGIEWLGAVPEHWKLSRIKELTQTESGTTPRSDNNAYYDDGTHYWIRTTDLNNDRLYDAEFKVTDFAVEHHRLATIPINSVLLAMYGGMGTIGKNALLQVEAVINQSVCAVLPNDKAFNAAYLWYFLQYFRPRWELFANSSRKDPNISQEVIKRLWVALPPLPEQQAIADFLDAKTAQIDRRIDLLTQEAAKYRQLKQSLINEAVTRGLDKSAPMKDSGVAWIGKVPVSWEMKRHKDCMLLITDRCTDSNRAKVALENIEGQTGRYLQTDSAYEGDGIRFRVGDILFGKLRPYLAKVLLADFEGSAVGDIFVYRPKPNILPRFAQHLMLSKRYLDVIDSSTAGAKMPRVSASFIAALPVFTPSIPEQEAIVQHLDGRTAQIDWIIGAITTQIDKLKELRKALINDVVTGKLRVT
ncbi:MAG: restriction endonuclease subunit S [Caldilineaceae bacterium]|nr:restriction endonuclease subunit S [Caldilineaceae bacterium]